VAGTLPDLDVLVDHGDPIRNMVLHRAETHAPIWLTLFSRHWPPALHGCTASGRSGDAGGWRCGWRW